MPIIAKASLPTKGSSTVFTLDKAALAAVASVVADAYYSDSSNWKEVSLVYRSSVGNQSEIVRFDASMVSPTANFAISLRARDVFQIHKIVIKDFDTGIFEVPRSELNISEFDVDTTLVPMNSVTWDINSNYSFQAGGGVTKTTSSTSVAVSTSGNRIAAMTPNYEVAYTFNGYLTTGTKIGIGQFGNIDGEEIAMLCDGTDNPFISILGSSSYRLSSYSLPPLNSGVNTFKIIRESNVWKFEVNGTISAWGSIGFNNFEPAVKLQGISTSIISTTAV